MPKVQALNTLFSLYDCIGHKYCGRMSSQKALCHLANGSRSWIPEKVVELGYKQGYIIRVGMLNFLTYDECEVFPGPRLNIILGPNGTGKSTITHAMCLACGGAPATVGRSPDIKQFVKHGKSDEMAYAEVDIVASESGKVVNVRRNISAFSKSSQFSIDGKKATEKEVKELMATLQIDVDNLCK